METTKQKEIVDLKYQVVKKRKEVMPTVWMFIGLMWGLLLNLVANILHDAFKALNYNLYLVIVFVLTVVTLIIFLWFVGRYYFEPIEKAEEEIRQLEGKEN